MCRVSAGISPKERNVSFENTASCEQSQSHPQRSRQSALANGLYGLNSKNTEPRCDPHLQVEQSNGINKDVVKTNTLVRWELIVKAGAN